MYTKLNKLSIISLVCFYLLYNIYISKIVNVIIFIMLYILLNFFIEDKINVLIIIYLFIIVYSIITHFHLLENFSSENMKSRYGGKNIEGKSIDEHQPGDVLDKNTAVTDQIKNYITKELSERLIKKYMEKVKRQNPNSIYTRKVKILDLIPIKSEISRSKLDTLKKNKRALKKPLIITDDNFILDGHHRWYILKSNINNTELESNEEKDFITCIIIKKNINEFVRNIDEYKMEYNEHELKGFKIDHNKLKIAKKSIETIKKNLKVIEDYNDELNKLNIV